MRSINICFSGWPARQSQLFDWKKTARKKINVLPPALTPAANHSIGRNATGNHGARSAPKSPWLRTWADQKTTNGIMHAKRAGESQVVTIYKRSKGNANDTLRASQVRIFPTGLAFFRTGPGFFPDRSGIFAGQGIALRTGSGQVRMFRTGPDFSGQVRDFCRPGNLAPDRIGTS